MSAQVIAGANIWRLEGFRASRRASAFSYQGRSLDTVTLLLFMFVNAILLMIPLESLSQFACVMPGLIKLRVGD